MEKNEIDKFFQQLDNDIKQKDKKFKSQQFNRQSLYEKQIFLLPDLNYQDQLDLLQSMVKYKKLLSINIQNFSIFFTLDMMFQLENQMRVLQNISTIYFYNVQLTKKHLRTLKSYLLQDYNKLLRIIFSLNNLNQRKLDYFIFGTHQLVKKLLNKNQLSLHIANNPGIFRCSFSDKILQQIPQSKIDLQNQTITINGRGNEQFQCKNCVFQKINVSSCFLQRNEKGLEALMDSIFNIDNISIVRSLNISNLNIENVDLAFNFFSQMLKNKNLEKLIMQQTPTHILETLAQAIKECKLNIKTLDLSRSQGISPSLIAKIMSGLSVERLILEQVNIQIQDLQMINEFNHIERSKAKQQPINQNAQIIPFFANIKYLNLSQNSLKGCMAVLGRILNKMNNLEFLAIRNCNLFSEDLEQLAQEIDSQVKSQQQQSPQSLLNKNQELQPINSTNNIVVENSQIKNICKINQSCIKYFSISLKSLDISQNKLITGKGWRVLFMTLSQFSNINFLDWSHCDLTEQILKDTLSPLQPQQLNLQENNDQQHFLDPNNQINNNNNKVQNFFLQLQHIQLTGNNKINAKGWQILFNILKDSETIQKIDIADCKINESSMELICHCLLDMNAQIIKSITSFNVSGNNEIDDNGWMNFFTFICKCQLFSDLQFKNCGFCNQNYHGLLFAMQSKSPFYASLRVLDLTGNNLLNAQAWSQIMTPFSENQAIQEIILDNCALTDEKVFMICQSLQLQNSDVHCVIVKSLISFSIASNPQIGAAGWLCMFQFFQNLQKLKKLDLSRNALNKEKLDKLNSINNEGYKLLEEIRFDDNQDLSMNGWQMLLEKFSHCEFVKVISFKSCQLDSEQVNEICQILQNSQNKLANNLHTLNFYGNGKLEEHGWNQFFNTIQQFCPTIKNLNLGGCGLNNTKMLLICESIKNVMKLRLLQINLSQNNKILPKQWKQFLYLIGDTIYNNGGNQIKYDNQIYSQGQIQSNYNINIENQTLIESIIIEQIKHKILEQHPIQYPLVSVNLDKNIHFNSDDWLHLFSLLAQYSNIEEINLKRCYLDDKKLSSMSQAIINLTKNKKVKATMLQSIKSINISNNKRIGYDGWDYFFSILSRCSKISDLNMNSCGLKTPVMLNFVKLLGINSAQGAGQQGLNQIKKTIRKLELASNKNIQSTVWQSFFHQLSFFEQLQSINLSNCNLREESLLNLALALDSSSQKIAGTLLQLNLSKNIYFTAKSFSTLILSLRKLSRLQTLQLEHCRLTDQALIIFNQDKDQQLLKKNSQTNQKNIEQQITFQRFFPKNLYVLNLSFNFKIKSQTWQKIFESLNNDSPNLMELYLQYCCLDEQALLSLTRTTNRETGKNQLQQSLKILNLLGNFKLTNNQVFTELCEFLFDCNCLIILNLGYCQLAHRQVNTLLGIFQTRIQKQIELSLTDPQSFLPKLGKTLKCIELIGNKSIQGENWKEIFEIFKRFYNLEIISLRNCNLKDQDLVMLIQSLFQQNQENQNKGWFINLKELNLSLNKYLTVKGCQSFIECLVQQINSQPKNLNCPELQNIILDILSKSDDEIFDHFIQNNKTHLKIIQKLCSEDIQNFKNLRIRYKIEILRINKENDLSQNQHQIGSQIQLNSQNQIKQISDIKKKVQNRNQSEFYNSLLVNQEDNQSFQQNQMYYEINNLPRLMSLALQQINYAFVNCKRIQIKHTTIFSQTLDKIGTLPINLFVSEYLNNIAIGQSQLSFTTTGLSKLCQVFSYYFLTENQQFRLSQINYQQFAPYPYRLLFNQFFYKNFFTQNPNIKQINVLSNASETEQERIQCYLIEEIYQELKHYKTIQKIYIDYCLNDELVNNILDKGTEEDLVKLILLLPPYKMEFKQNLSLSTWKAIYSIIFDSTNFQHASVQYDSTSSLNLGIALSIREKLYTLWRPHNIILRLFRWVIYKFLSIFKSDSPIYKFSDEVKQLNTLLVNQKSYFYSMFIIILIYYFLVCFCPPYFTLKDQSFDSQTCDEGISMISHYIYIAFAVITAIIEGIMLYKVQLIVANLIPDPADIQHYDETKVYNKYEEAIFSIKKKIVGKKYLFLLFKFFKSQLARYDLYNDIVFLVICIQCQFYKLAIASLVIIIYVILWELFQLAILFRRSLKEKNMRKISSYEINQFYQICSLLNFKALDELLDYISPYNVFIIPNNQLTRFLMPSFAGKAVNEKIFNAIQNFIFQDLPQVIIKFIFVLYLNSGSYNTTVLIALITSMLSVVISLYNILSVRPQIISQLVFNDLVKLQKKQILQESQRIINMEGQQTVNFFNNYHEKEGISLEIIPDECLPENDNIKQISVRLQTSKLPKHNIIY